MAINLEDILKAGTASNEYTTKEIVWFDGETRLEGEVEVKKETNVEDYEYIYFRNDDQPSSLARRISRMVRFNGQHLTYDQAAGLKDSLLLALSNALSEGERAEEAKADAEKK